MLGLPFITLTAWLIPLAVFVGLDFWLLTRNKRALLGEIDLFFQEQKKLVYLAEGLFILAYSYLVNLRSFMPEIRDQEKFGDFAFLNSLSLHSSLPPNDPWMNGLSINYYYFSHFMMALLTKMSGVAPSIAFNLAVPLIFALTATASFGLIYNLVQAARGEKKGFLAAGLAGLLGATFICLFGNPEAVRQIFFPGNGALSFGGFNWWDPSRVIYDFMPQPNGYGGFVYRLTQTITEFPMFSFLLADAHPHVMALPFVLLVIGAALNLLLMPAGSIKLDLRAGEGRYFFFWLALAIGSLYFLNTWDFPIYLILVVLAVLLRELRVGTLEIQAVSSGNQTGILKAALLGGILKRKSRNSAFLRLARWLGFVVRLSLASLVLYLPFHLTFTSLIGDNFVPETVNIPVISSLAKTFLLVVWDRTPLIGQTILNEAGQPEQRGGYLFVFGFFLYPILCLVALKAWNYFKTPYSDSPDQNGEIPPSIPVFASNGFYFAVLGVAVLIFSEILSLLRLNPVLTLLTGLLAIPILGVGAGLMAKDYLARIRPGRPSKHLQLLAFGTASIMTLSGWILHFELYGPLLILLTLASLLAWFDNNRKEKGQSFISRCDQFVMLLVALPALITFGIEIIFLRDVFNARLNTIFKFYYQAWVMYGLAAAYATWRVAAWGWKLAPFTLPDEELVAPEFQPALEVVSQPHFQPQPALSLAGAGGEGSFFNSFQTPAPRFGPGDVLAGEEPGEQDVLAEAAFNYSKNFLRREGWRWFFGLSICLLILAGMVYPLFAPFEKSGHFKDRKGLDGEQWLSLWYPEDYGAIKWLRTEAAKVPGFEGPVLETAGPDWFDYNRVGTFSGFPVLMGWPGHESQWRGGKASSREEVTRRVQDVDTIYSILDPNKARTLLQQYGIKFVFVGSLETGLRDGRWYDGSGKVIKKNYPPEALAKFNSFMKTVYQKDGVTIYSF